MTGIIILFLICVGGFAFCIIIGKMIGGNDPIDDKGEPTDIEKLRSFLSGHLGNKQEIIVGVLGKYNVLNDETIRKNGLCFVTDVAYYFIGSIWQKKFIFNWKSNVQHRIVATQINGVKLKNLFPWYALVYLVFLVFAGYKYIDIFKHLPQDAEYSFGVFVFFCLILISTLFFIIYSILVMIFRRNTTIDIEFGSQTFCFLINRLGRQEIKDFYSAVSSIQENVESRLTEQKRETSNFNTKTNRSVSAGERNFEMRIDNKITALQDLTKLYEQNSITEDEFKKLKKELLGNEE